MKNSTLIFVKNNKRLLFILNILFSFFGALIYLNTQKNIFLLQIFPWFSSSIDIMFYGLLSVFFIGLSLLYKLHNIFSFLLIFHLIFF